MSRPRFTAMDISIVVPFNNAKTETPVWAEEERKINFRSETVRAARCTTAFAAVELKRYISKTIYVPKLSFCSERPESGFFIELRIVDYASKNTNFGIEPYENGILITGQGRTGLLYGAYEFLRMQGWRWYSPGKNGEILPELSETLTLPKRKKTYQPSLSLDRGFYFEGVSKESAELLLWMARNRLNVSGFRPTTASLSEKLGMSPKAGGHIFEEILNPDRIAASGKTLWEEEPEWYGLPSDGKRKKERALSTQFCVSSPALLKFLNAEIISRLTGEWKWADRIDVWGFDTWGNVCTCPACQKLGNSTDQNLFFISNLRQAIDQARTDGYLDHAVQLVICAYEGTCTISGPSNPFPRNLIDAGDYVVFYPINRCYAHNFSDSSCPDNVSYHTFLKSWFSRSPRLPIAIGEYYNVSKFEDLPLLFTRRISNDIPDYYTLGARGITYMHVPMVNWGMRTLTQLMYAQLAWDINTDVKSFLNEYFTNRYGPYAEKMRRVYRRIEEAWLYIAQWRAWSAKSILSQLLCWDGTKPRHPLANEHFTAPAEIIKSGQKSLELLQSALVIINQVRTEEQKAVARDNFIGDISGAVNPAEARKLENSDRCEMCLGEDRRLLFYGIDTMRIMNALVTYHNALYGGNTREANSAWKETEITAESLDSYFIPIDFEWPGPGLESKDGLTRSQLRGLLRRCRKHRT